MQQVVPATGTVKGLGIIRTGRRGEKGKQMNFFQRIHCDISIRHPLFRAQGMHLGSVIAEAAWKTIVNTRTKRCGMRWTPEGVDALLHLRTAVLNGIYDSFWEEDYAA